MCIRDRANTPPAFIMVSADDRLCVDLCLSLIHILGNQDTIYTGAKFTRLYFKDCYIDGTTAFIFGPSTALFEDCIINSKRNSYVTAASTPKEAKYGYVFKHCKLRCV